MMSKEDTKSKQDEIVKKVATEISFRLLATSRHPDQTNALKKINKITT